MTFTLEILHTSDQEAGIPALKDAVGLSAVMNALVADPRYTNTIRLTSGDTFIAGPFFNASQDLYDDSTEQEPANQAGIADILIQNELGWDAAAIGNHEFDAGTSTFLNLLAPQPNIVNGTKGGKGIGSGGYPGAQFPYLSNNLDFSALLPNGLPEDLQIVANGLAPQANSISGSVVIEENGELIGVIAVVTPYLPLIAGIRPVEMLTPPTTQADSAQVQAQRLADNVQPEVDRLTARGINKIILMTHLQEAEIEQALAQSALTDVDVIIGGGSHRLMASPGTPVRQDETQVPPQRLEPYPQEFTNQNEQTVYYVNTAANYRYLSRLIAEFDDNGVITQIGEDSSTFATDIAGVDRLYTEEITTFAQVQQVADPEIVEIVSGVENFVNDLDGTIYGNTRVFLNGIRGDVRTQETNLGNLTADANDWYAEQYGFAVDISFKNGGGIRDQIGRSFIDGGSNELIQTPPDANPAVGKEAGDISQLDIANSLRFDNSLSVATVSAEGLKHIAEHMVARTSAGNTPGQFGQIGGFRYSYDLNGQAIAFSNGVVTTPGTRIRSLAISKDDGSLDVVVRDGAIVGNPQRTFTLVTLSFLAAGGDGYPGFVFENVRSLGDLETPPSLNQANLEAGGEQDALAEYLQVFYPFASRAYRQADTPIELDERIQSLQVRGDTVFTPTAQTALFNYEQLLRSGFLGNLDPSISTVELNGLPVKGFFDENYYRALYPDVAQAISQGAFSSGLAHFLANGRFEGRNPSSLYNETFYLQDNSDVAEAVSQNSFASGFEHYLIHGQIEGRSPSELFDELLYRARYPDVGGSLGGDGFTSGFDHYVSAGAQEGRLPLLSLYNEAYYLENNPDVAQAVASDNFVDGLAHYLSFGQGEGRNPSSLFHEQSYLTLNPDVAAEVNQGLWFSGFQHYLAHGRAENRLIF